MNKLIFTFIALFFLNNCSFNENSRIWKDKEKDLSENKIDSKLFAEKSKEYSDLNEIINEGLKALKFEPKSKQILD